MIRVGDVFSSWIVVDGPFIDGKRKRWHCLCDCGNESLVGDYDLRSGKSVRCRTCASSQLRNKNRDRVYANIEHRDRLAAVARNAISRCEKNNHKRYKDYGERGIKVYEPWLNDLVTFVEYLATLEGNDNPELLLDRIDNDGDYAPGNLRFVTRSDSQRNRRTARGGHPYYMRHGFSHCFKRLHDLGFSFKTIGNLYCEQESTVRNVVRELETGHAFGG